MSEPLRYLLTAGPTREHLDPVRFISNAASGRLGIEMSRYLQDTEARVDLVLGPTSLSPPDRVSVKKVTTAEEMRTAVIESFSDIDVLVMTAAVCDLRPRDQYDTKREKQQFTGSITLESTPDILKEAGQMKTHQYLVGFTVGSENLEEAARRKRSEKNLDLMIANAPSAMGAREQDALLVAPDEEARQIPADSKKNLARALIDEIRGRIRDRETGGEA